MEDVLSIATTMRENGRVDVVKLANELGLSVYPITDVRAIFKSAYIQKDNGTFSIHVNGSQSKQRQRFSIAHEVAHYSLHRKELEERGVLDRSDSSGELSPEMEQEADRLAAEILMPKADIAAQLGDVVGEEKPVAADMIARLSERYDVSFPAMMVRLRELNYFVPLISSYAA